MTIKMLATVTTATLALAGCATPTEPQTIVCTVESKTSGWVQFYDCDTMRTTDKDIYADLTAESTYRLGIQDDAITHAEFIDNPQQRNLRQERDPRE